MKTLALVIGNNSYHESAELTNAKNDAIAIQQVFERLGYDVIFQLDCKASDYTNLLSEFASKVKDYDASIFFYAGHGFELDGENYLPAIDCQIPPSNKYEAERHSIRISELLDIYKKHSNKVNIAIIDACRKAFDRGGNVALTPIIAPKGTLLAFSTSPNEGASDSGFEGNSIYTGALLKYLGREHLSVEDLFKKVRKTVYALSEGRKTTWEHTSLINDFFFNTGQLVHSIDIPYSSDVVKDINYSEASEFGTLISDLKSYNWHIQNPSIDKILRIPSSQLNKNQQFVLGRNLLQASGAAASACNFMEQIRKNILRYSLNGENHVLNGILFEIYFNAYGEFRKASTKKHYIEEVLALRKDSSFDRSFAFIGKLILNTGYHLIYIPKNEDEFIDIDVVATEDKSKDFLGNEEIVQVISQISYNGINITEQIKSYHISRENEESLKRAISNFFTAPVSLIQINSQIKIESIAFIKSITTDADLF